MLNKLLVFVQLFHYSNPIHPIHMGQFLQGGKNGREGPFLKYHNFDRFYPQSAVFGIFWGRITGFL